jgi:hypothetical protein
MRVTDETTFTEADRDMLTKLAHAVFGIPGDQDGGLLYEMRELNAKLGRIYMAVITAAISFGFGSIAVVVAIVAVAG